MDMFEVMMDPKKHGYQICDHCNGYGSSLKEASDRCTKCGGVGVTKKERKKIRNQFSIREHRPTFGRVYEFTRQLLKAHEINTEEGVEEFVAEVVWELDSAQIMYVFSTMPNLDDLFKGQMEDEVGVDCTGYTMEDYMILVLNGILRDKLFVDMGVR